MADTSFILVRDPNDMQIFINLNQIVMVQAPANGLIVTLKDGLQIGLKPEQAEPLKRFLEGITTKIGGA